VPIFHDRFERNRVRTAYLSRTSGFLDFNLWRPFYLSATNRRVGHTSFKRVARIIRRKTCQIWLSPSTLEYAILNYRSANHIDHSQRISIWFFAIFNNNNIDLKPYGTHDFNNCRHCKETTKILRQNIHIFFVLENHTFHSSSSK